MPIYKYECRSCGEEFEALKSIDNRHDIKCNCGGDAKLVISPWGRVIFAGWDTVVSSNGKIMARRQSTDDIPMLPEKVHGSRF